MPHIFINKPSIPSTIIHNIIYIGQINYTTHLHLKTPKTKNTKYYTWNNSKIILLGGDIHPNPGPSSQILKNLPREFKQWQQQYFTNGSLTLKAQYAHLEGLFAPYITQTSTSPQNPELPHIRRHSSTLSKYPTHHQLYTFIIVYSPIPDICNQLMTNDLDPNCLTILQRLHNLPTNTDPHLSQILTPTPNTQINTITQAYSRINNNLAKGKPTNLQELQTELPHIPRKILEELTRCTQPIRGYHPPTQDTNPNPTPAIITNTYNHQAMTTLKIITWNTGCISSSLPGIQELTQTLPTTPHIILIQETKLQKLKSTTYIDRKLHNYKIIYNNSNNPTNNQTRFAGPTKTRGGILAMIPKAIYTMKILPKYPPLAQYHTTYKPSLSTINLSHQYFLSTCTCHHTPTTPTLYKT
jgi:hypothetical protein